MTDTNVRKYADIPPNTQCRALIPYLPPADPPRRSFGRRAVTFVCAVFCLFSVTAAGINLALMTEHFSAADLLLRLGERAFLGMASITPVQERDMPPFPPADTADGADTAAVLPSVTPSDTSDETQDSPGEDDTPAPTADTYPIAEADISAGGNVHALFNETTYAPDTEALLAAPLSLPTPTSFTAKYGADAPYILIIHTHGTEAYAADGADTYTTEDTFRSTDTTKNVVAVGTVMAETFESAGISTLHCTEMFDALSYQDSYSRAAAAIRAYLAEYPSIQIVLDVHRDSIIRADMTKIRPVTTIDGEQIAQFMIVAGTDYKGADHPNWRENLSFALKIQENLIGRAERFARAVNLRGAGFNQQYTKGSLLLEVGSCGNTLIEAKRAGKLAAEAIAQVLAESGKEDKAITISALPHPRAD